ncbi:MAG: TIGR01777 family oxidoreductase [Ornithinimicrobium sp.]
MSQERDDRRCVAITGSSGMIGAALSKALRDRGDRVVHVVRCQPRADGLEDGVREVQWAPEQREFDTAILDGVTTVVHLAGAGIGDHRWTSSYKEAIRASRVDGTEAVAAAVAARPAVRLISGSAIGYYGDRGSDVLTEDSGLGEGFLAEVCRDWEAATWRARQAGASVALARTGIVLSPSGGAMGRMLPLAKFGLAGPLGSGKQFWAWITLHDQIRALLFLVDHPQISGPVNLTAPTPDPQVDVVKALGEALRRPTVLPAPTIALRVALGEMAGDILGSQRALPTVLSEAGFRWDHAELDAAMAWLTEQTVKRPGDSDGTVDSDDTGDAGGLVDSDGAGDSRDYENSVPTNSESEPDKRQDAPG